MARLPSVTLALARTDFAYTVLEISLYISVGLTVGFGGLAVWCYHLSQRRKTNRKCALSLSLSFGAASVIGMSAFVLGQSRLRFVGVLLFVLMIPVTATAVGLAIAGLKECARRPDKYQRGKTMGILTLILAGLLACLFIPALVSGYKHGVAAVARGRMLRSSASVIRFESLNFAFRHPGAPWVRSDPKLFGPAPLLAFMRPDPLYLTVTAKTLEPAYSDDRKHLVEICKGILENETTSYQLVSEGEISGSNPPAWQTETRATFQGHQFFYVTRIMIADGIGYRLATWGPVDQADHIKSAAHEIAGGFELISRP